MQTSTRLLLNTLALSFSTISAALAQAFYYIPAPTVVAPQLAGASYVARVVDARPQHASIGLVQNGSIRQAATFREGVVGTLQAFFHKYAPGQPGAVPLVVRVSGLEIAELPGSIAEGRLGQLATAGLVADFYAPQPDSSYQLVAHFAQLREYKALDVTGSHSSNLGYLLLEAAVMSSQPGVQPPSGPRFSRAEIFGSQLLAKEGLPVLSPACQPRPGFYNSLTDFWHNTPSEPGQPLVEQRAYTTLAWAGDFETKAYRTVAGRKVPASEVWGFCDGQHFYVRRGNVFYKLERLGSDFAFFGPADEDPEYRKAASSRAGNTGTFFGGAVIGLAVAATDAAISHGERAQLKLSTLTGEVRLAQSDNSAATAIANRPTHLFIYRPRSAKGPAVRVRLAAGQPAQELVAGDFLTFEPASDQPVQVYVVPAAGPESSVTVTPTTEAATYLEYRPTGPQPLRQVKESVGAAAVTRLVK